MRLWEKAGIIRTCVAAAIMIAAAGMPFGTRALAQENSTPPPGIEVWNGEILTPQHDLVWKGNGKPFEPVTIAAARNGSFSGKIVVGSKAAMKGLKAEVGDLACANGRIPSSAVQVRYPSLHYMESWTSIPKGVSHFDALQERPPAEVPVLPPSGRAGVEKWTTLAHACQPVWFIVNVPKDAKPGEYEGKITVTVGDAPPFALFLKLKVHDYVLPDTGDYATCTDLIQSPETIAMRYDVPLWSDRHFELIGRSFAILKKAGNRSVYIHLICETNQGNDQTMVRWIRDGEKYRYDFTPMEKYLDAVERNMHRPRIVVLYAWDVFLANNLLNDLSVKHHPEATVEKWKELQGKGPSVSLLDPATGEVEKMQLPPYKDPKARELWKPLYEALLARLKKRGMEQSLYIGCAADERPSKEDGACFSTLAPGIPWAMGSHDLFYGSGDRRMTEAGAPVKYASLVWGTYGYGSGQRDPKIEDFMNWKESDVLITAYYRGWLNQATVQEIGLAPERSTRGRIRGVGRIGADFWPVMKDKRGRQTGTLGGRFPQSMWRNLDIRMCILAPGEDSTLSTARFEALCEGVQQCEAILMIQKALYDKTIDGDLAVRCEEMLAGREKARRVIDSDWRKRETVEEQHARLDRFAAADWQGWADRLYAAAAEVQKALGAR